MTDLSVRVELAAVRDSPEVADKVDILRTIARIGETCYGLDADTIRTGLAAREELGSTGFGRSIAIPHTKLASLDHCVGIFLRLAEPVSFDAHDGKPVDLIFALLSPQKAGAEHLRRWPLFPASCGMSIWWPSCAAPRARTLSMRC